jgi:hypothetical protein
MKQPWVEKGEFQGWQAVSLHNELVRIVAVPEIGGRIMAYDLGTYPFLFVDPLLAGKLFSAEENQGDGGMACWKNYGGDKTWPSPQGWDNEQQWPGPPDPVLDTGIYTLSEQGVAADGSATLTMVSPPDARTGIQITRKITLRPGTTRLVLDLSFTNIKNKPVRWGIWDVTQFDAARRLADGSLTYEPGCSITAPLNPSSRFSQGINLMFGEKDNPQWHVDRSQGLVVADYAWKIGKIGTDACTSDGHSGWVAFANTAQGYAFTERFQVFPGEEYPDDGSTVECWTVGKGTAAGLDYAQRPIYLMETEVLSPLYTLQPGGSCFFQIEWGACRTGGRIVDVRQGGCSSQKLAAQPEAGQVRLRGSFGVFDEGNLRLTWLDSSGKATGSILLGAVNPNSLIDYDEVFQAPASATSAVLSVVAEADGLERCLAVCNIPVHG